MNIGAPNCFSALHGVNFRLRRVSKIRHRAYHESTVHESCCQLLKSRILRVFLLFLLQSCSSTLPVDTTSNTYGTNFVPQDWISDFTYEEPLQGYLQRHATIARELGKRPLVFLFADWCQPCRRIRNRMQNKRMVALFQDKYIVMINYDYIQHQVDRKNDICCNPFRAVPAFIPIGVNGDFVGPAIYGDAWRDNIPHDDLHALERYFEFIDTGKTLR